MLSSYFAGTNCDFTPMALLKDVGGGPSTPHTPLTSVKICRIDHKVYHIASLPFSVHDHLFHQIERRIPSPFQDRIEIEVSSNVLNKNLLLHVHGPARHYAGDTHDE